MSLRSVLPVVTSRGTAWRRLWRWSDPSSRAVGGFGSSASSVAYTSRGGCVTVNDGTRSRLALSADHVPLSASTDGAAAVAVSRPARPVR